MVSVPFLALEGREKEGRAVQCRERGGTPRVREDEEATLHAATAPLQVTFKKHACALMGAAIQKNGADENENVKGG